jgi:beta-galactosidase
VVWGLSPLEIAVQRPIPEGRREAPFLWGWEDQLQSWTWPGAEGKVLNIDIYTVADRVKIELNGRVLDDKALTPATSRISRCSVPYAPGRLVVTAYLKGRQIGQRALVTAGAPKALRIKMDRTRIDADRDDLAYATIEVVDDQGRLVPDAVCVLRTVLSGGIELAAFGNANPRGVASFRQPIAKSWHGRALAIVRPTGGVGVATIRVEADGLRSGEAAIAMATK